MRPIALREPLLLGLAPGKWDRFATFGEKIQDGQKFEFTPETLGQIVDNFARLYKGRRIGMDCEHQALYASENGRPAPNLAYYNALAVIQDGQVAKFYAQRPDVQPPDPSELLGQLRERFPDFESADGLWGFRCEHTPLGQQLLPNYEQLSPLFAAEDTDEQGNDIGYRLMNVSAVNVAFQDGTVLNLSKLRGLSFNSSELHVPGADEDDKTPKQAGSGLSESKQGVTTMADEPNKDEDENPVAGSATRAQACKSLGLPDDASDDAFYGAILATEKAKMGDLVVSHEGDDEEEQQPMADEDMLPPEMMAAFRALTKQKGVAAAQAFAAAYKSSTKALSGAQERAVASLSKEVAEAKRELHRMQQDAAEKAADEQARAFARTAVSEGRWPAESEQDLVALSKAGQGEQAIKPFAKGTFGALSRRMTQAGAPIGASPVQAADLAQSGLRGAGLSAMAKQLLDEGKAKDMREALRLAYKQNPSLYH